LRRVPAKDVLAFRRRIGYFRRSFHRSVHSTQFCYCSSFLGGADCEFGHGCLPVGAPIFRQRFPPFPVDATVLTPGFLCRLWFIIREYHDFVSSGVLLHPLSSLVFAASTLCTSAGIRPLPPLHAVTLLLSRTFTMLYVPSKFSVSGKKMPWFDIWCILGFSLWLEYVSDTCDSHLRLPFCDRTIILCLYNRA
jgi:hypothetical protein